MDKLSGVSFSIKYDYNKTRLDSSLFRLVKHKNKYYAANFKDDLLSEVEPFNISNQVKEYLKSLPNNFAKMIFSKKNIIEVINITNYKKVESLHIYVEEDYNDLPDFYNVENDKGVVIYNHIYDSEENTFYIKSKYSNNRFFQVKRKVEYFADNEEELSYYLIDDKAKVINNLNDYMKVLIIGNISFVKQKINVSISDQQRLSLIELDAQNYLNLWEKYNILELTKEFQEFKKSGYIRFEYLNENTLKLYFDDENFKKIDSPKLNFKNNMIVIGNKGLTTLFECNNINEFKKTEKELLKNGSIIIASFREKTFNKVEKTVIVNSQDKPFFQKLANGGFVCLSLLGNQISSKRRENAKSKIINGESGMKNLFSLFTDDPIPNNKRDRIEIDHRLTKNKNLTHNQEEAINIIINTPDIAVIQGPPGTGKTTVILEALTQLNSKEENKFTFGNNLLSGFRHETVLNMTENIDLFGLPAVKVGEKDSDDKDDVEPKIMDFINDLKQSLNDKYEDLSVSDEEYNNFKKKYYSYVNFNNSIESTIEILNDVKNLSLFKFDINVNNKIEEIIKSLNKRNDNTFEEKIFLDFLYSLPLNIESFIDNEQRLINTIGVLKEYKGIKDDVLKLDEVFNQENIDFNNIRNIRRNLIIKHKKQPAIITSKKEKEEVIKYLNSLFERVKTERYKKVDGDKIAILEYIDSLNENPSLIRDTLIEYTKILGATNQHSISKSMFEIKGENNVLFDNVIVDEAATSSPLDLFIPMSLAKERIVLVGDHRQLPNIVNNELLQDVLSDAQVEDDKLKEALLEELKSTIFEVIMEKAYKLEKKDGIKRVITLNTQFRMHPSLGEIVSNNFYLSDGGIYSPRLKEDFAHNYHGLTNEYLYWLDSPYDKKESYRLEGSSSRKNTLEAKKIAKHIKEALDDENCQNNTIGIITIFKDQENEVKKALYEVGVFDKEYKKNDKYKPYVISIGTVDAFQGREFDIVYLSLTYVSSNITKEKNPYSRLAGETSDSLLCVALSRQKKLLIVAGDLNLYKHDLCKTKVPSLHELATRCYGGGKYE